MARAEEYVCSPMTGQLVASSGAAVAGVEIRREWVWRGKTGADTTLTDAEGRFAFDAVPARRGLFGRLPAQETVTQTYYADLPDGSKEILWITTQSLELLSETGGKPFNVRCTSDVDGNEDGFGWGTCTLID